MAWDFIKKLTGNREKAAKDAALPPAAPKAAAPAPAPAAAEKPAATAAAKAAPREKSPADKTDDELAEELNKLSPQILAQAKAPQQRSLIIGIYRKMLIAKVDINDDKEVKRWMQKNPQVLQGGEAVKVETVRRDAPKVGRNEDCPCGSGKKYKKCCGK
ncbi:MAG TPA: SEC-C metal-binding domain-containing protein [Elusimicrobiales bacterium]|nr:SEC-C metal-binding domain-containing protein [Elusimicrobiales bacterium]